MSEEIEKHILHKYEIIQKLGKGAYGVVWKARERKSQKIIAIKKVSFSLRYLTPSTTLLTLRELIEKLFFFNN